MIVFSFEAVPSEIEFGWHSQCQKSVLRWLAGTSLEALGMLNRRDDYSTRMVDVDGWIDKKKGSLPFLTDNFSGALGFCSKNSFQLNFLTNLKAKMIL